MDDIQLEKLLKDLISLPHNEEISKALRKEVKMYPEVAIREFVANALIHQDLSISGAGPMIEIFDNRIEITNTGEPLIETDRFIDHPPRSRNEDMASFMRQVGVCEEGGTGIDRALINIALYQLPAPSFEKFDNFTKITLYAHKDLKEMTLDDKVRACFQHCVLKHIEKSRMTNATLRERLGIGEKNYPAASAIIKATIKKGFIKESEKPKEYVPIWA
ncbi:MAG: ATP-binding protein [Parcubacteria group bacterium]|jgi:predicted HTH transcriptional regulator